MDEIFLELTKEFLGYQYAKLNMSPLSDQYFSYFNKFITLKPLNREKIIDSKIKNKCDELDQLIKLINNDFTIKIDTDTAVKKPNKANNKKRKNNSNKNNKKKINNKNNSKKTRKPKLNIPNPKLDVEKVIIVENTLPVENIVEIKPLDEPQEAPLPLPIPNEEKEIIIENIEIAKPENPYFTQDVVEKMLDIFGNQQGFRKKNNFYKRMGWGKTDDFAKVLVKAGWYQDKKNINGILVNECYGSSTTSFQMPHVDGFSDLYIKFHNDHQRKENMKGVVHGLIKKYLMECGYPDKYWVDYYTDHFLNKIR